MKPRVLSYNGMMSRKLRWMRDGVMLWSFPSGYMPLDLKLRDYGFQRGCISEVYGDSMIGKTSLSMMCVGQAQRRGCICLWVDGDYSFDRSRAECFGVDVDDLLYHRPLDGGITFDILESVVSSGVVDLVVIDTLTGISFGGLSGIEERKELERRLWRLHSVVADSGCVVLAVDQLRVDIRSGEDKSALSGMDGLFDVRVGMFGVGDEGCRSGIVEFRLSLGVNCVFRGRMF